MLEEILINVTPQETRVATVENGVLNEVCIERRTKTTLVGNIYMGKVCLLYTSPSPRDKRQSRMPSSA